jgi:hypothetical protein
MLTLPPGTEVFLATERVDGRKGINGLSTLVRSQFDQDPLSGRLFVFFSRRTQSVASAGRRVPLKAEIKRRGRD